jgi:hypothetical protein
VQAEKVILQNYQYAFCFVLFIICWRGRGELYMQMTWDIFKGHVILTNFFDLWYLAATELPLWGGHANWSRALHYAWKCVPQAAQNHVWWTLIVPAWCISLLGHKEGQCWYGEVYRGTVLFHLVHHEWTGFGKSWGSAWKRIISRGYFADLARHGRSS